MMINTVLEPESVQIPMTYQWETLPAGIHTKEIDIIAIRLWQRGSCIEMVGDECCFCKGEAQRCLAICQ
jgi:hypothetical protein